MENDAIHKFTYRHRALFADLMRLVAPALAAELDFDRAVELPAAYVEAAGERFEQRFGDMAWRVPRRDAGDEGPASLVAVVEYQSTVNWRMAERMRDYRRMARDRLASGDGAAALPIVLYNGSERWTAPGAAAQIPAPWSAAAQLALAPFQGWDYVLYSLERLMAGGGLAHLPLANRAAATLRLQAARTPTELLARMQQEWVRFAGPAEAATRRILHAWAGALLADLAGTRAALPALAELEGLEGGKEMTTVSQALLGKWYAEFRAVHVAEGMEQGVARGIEQGVQRGIEQGVTRGIEQGTEQARTRGLARLRRQAAIKFGAQTAERLHDLLGTALPADRLERLEDRTSEWLMACEHGEDLLARVSAFIRAER